MLRSIRVVIAAGTALSLAAVGLTASASVGIAPALASAGPATGHGRAVAGWGKATKVPGLAALNHGWAYVGSVSCASAGNCTAGGSYRDSSGAGYNEAFVVSQVHGTWGQAIEVPGIATLNFGVAEISSVSCGSAGNCSAGGSYIDGDGLVQAFVVNQVHGTWGKAIEVPGTAALNGGGQARISSVSCASADNCSAGGYYWDISDSAQAFVVSETGGTWGQAIEVPGTAALNQLGNAGVSSVSCPSAGNCTAGGDYDSRSGGQAFVVSENSGTWGQAIEVPGTAALNHLVAGVSSVSCGSAGNCTAGGSYTDSSGHTQAFVASQASGTWGKAIEVPGTAALNQRGNATVSSLSCASAGNCTAGGSYTDSSRHLQAFVARETSGTWREAGELTGTAALNQGGSAAIASVSCPSAGNCSAGGSYTDGSGHLQAFVASQASGAWGKAIEVPGTASLNQGGNAGVGSVSCPSAGNCSAGGSYYNNLTSSQAFVVSETQPAPAHAR